MRISEYYADSSNWIKFDMGEVEKLTASTTFQIEEIPNYIEVKRIITISEIRKYMPEVTTLDGLYLKFADLKAAFIETDARFLWDMGYKDIEMLDIAPGNTAVSYILRATRK